MIKTKDTKIKIAIAWASWFCMLIFGGFILVSVIQLLILYYEGGSTLISDIWLKKEKGNYLWVILTSASLGLPIGVN